MSDAGVGIERGGRAENSSSVRDNAFPMAGNPSSVAGNGTCGARDLLPVPGKRGRVFSGRERVLHNGVRARVGTARRPREANRASLLASPFVNRQSSIVNR